MNNTKSIVVLKGKLKIDNNTLNFYGNYKNAPDLIQIDLSKLGVLNDSNLMGGLTAYCGKNKIDYGYSQNVKVDFIESCNSDDMSYLLFAPKKGTEDTYSIGDGVDSISANLLQTNEQNGNFYHMITCSEDNSNVALTNFHNVLIHS